jgi:hypothetical protein
MKRKLVPFMSLSDLPLDERTITEVLKRDPVKEIRNFVLAPLTSNIPQACKLWAQKAGLVGKCTYVAGTTPDVYISQALAVREEGVLPLAWTCAVYNQEAKQFFRHPDMSMFFISTTMPLDHMQLATRPQLIQVAGCSESEILEQISNCIVPQAWTRVATHPSPQYLVSDLLEVNEHLAWIEATSNGAAAEMCRDGQVELAVVTETARQATGLIRLFDWECPPMVFFGGLTAHGADIFRLAFDDFRRWDAERCAASAKAMIAHDGGK